MFDLLIFINAAVVIVGGILAVSALIIANKPDARQMIDKLVPFQALIGVGMIALSLVNFLRLMGVLTDMFKLNFMWALGVWCMFGAGIGLGLLFGMPQIVKWIPGESNAEQKAMELTQKIAPFQILLGLIGMAGSVLVLLFMFKIMKFT
jgi:hypothetical protein